MSQVRPPTPGAEAHQVLRRLRATWGDALGFYQRLGLDLVAVRLGAVDAARRDLEPQIPELGVRGIPIRHEIELEGPVASGQDQEVP